MRRVADEPIEFGKLELCQVHYREFACSVATFEWLQAGGMTHLDGIPVSLQLMDTMVGGHNVFVKIWDAPEMLDEARELQKEAAGWAA